MAIGGVLRPRTSYNQETGELVSCSRLQFSEGNRRRHRIGHRAISGWYSALKITRDDRWNSSACSSKCDNAPRESGVRLAVPILFSQVLVQGYFTASREPVARGLSTWLKRVVHASYTWFMDRGPYSDARRILGQWNVPNNTLVTRLSINKNQDETRPFFFFLFNVNNDEDINIPRYRLYYYSHGNWFPRIPVRESISSILQKAKVKIIHIF